MPVWVALGGLTVVLVSGLVSARAPQLGTLFLATEVAGLVVLGGSLTLLLRRVTSIQQSAIDAASVADARVAAADAAKAESDHRLRLAVEAGRLGMWDADLRTGKAVTNASYARMLGYDPRDFHETYESFVERLHADDRERVQAATRAHLEGHSPEYRVESRQRTATGSWKWILSVGRVIERDANGTPIRLIGTHTDITDLKEAEARVVRYTQRAQGLLDLPRVAELMTEKEFMQHGQGLIEELTGSTISFTHFVHEDEEAIELVTWSRRTLRDYCTAVYDSHYPISQAGIWAEAFRMRRAVVFNDYAGAHGKRGLPQGHARLDRFISVPVIDGGKVRMLTGVGNRETDYTEMDVETVQLFSNEIWRILKRRREEAALRASEDRFRRLFDANPHPMWVFDPTSLRFLAVNTAACARYGYRRDEFLAMSMAELIPPDDLAMLGGGLSSAVTRRLASSRVSRHRNKLGALLDVDMSMQEVDFDGRPAMLALALDVTDQRHAAAVIAENEERLRLTMAVMGLAAWEFDLSTSYISRSPLFDQLYGLPWQGTTTMSPFVRRIHPEDQAAFKQAIEAAALPGHDDRFEITYRVLWPDLTMRWLQCSGRVELRDAMGHGLKARGLLHDVTARKTAELDAEVQCEELARHAAELERQLATRPS